VQNKGAQLYNMNDYDNAYRCFMEVRSVKKFFDGVPYEKKLDDSDATFNAALCLFKLKRKDEAKTMFQELIDRSYDSPTIYQILASCYTDEGNDAKAIEIIGKGTEKYPGEVSLIIDELNIYIKQGKVGEHIAKLEKAANMDSSNAQIWYALAVAYDELKNAEKAEAAYLKAVVKDPNHYNAYNNLGALFYNQGVQLNKEMMDDTKLTEKQYSDLQTKRNDLYKKALPYFEKAFCIKQDEKAIQQALKEVYAKLEMYEKSKEVKDVMAGKIKIKIGPGCVRIGMSKNTVEYLLGKPNNVNTTVTNNVSSEQWIYDGYYLYFDDGSLTAWQESK